MTLRNAFEGLAVEPKQDTQIERLASILAKLSDVGLDAATLEALETINVTGPLTDAQLRAASVPVALPSLPAGVNNIGYTSPATSQKVGQGRFFLAGTGRLTMSVAGNLRMIASNPAGSGKTISIVRVSGMSTSTGWATILINPTAGVPATAARPTMNAVIGGGLPSVLQLRVDTDTTTPMSGGVDTGLVLGLPGGNRSQLDMPPLVLAAGVTMGLNVPFAGAADAAMSLYWIED